MRFFRDAEISVLCGYLSTLHTLYTKYIQETNAEYVSIILKNQAEAQT